LKANLVVLCLSTSLPISAAAEFAEGCVFDTRIDCKTGSDKCSAFGSDNLEDASVPLKTPEIRRMWVYTKPGSKEKEIMLCADEGQTRCIKGDFTQRRTKDGAYIGVSILQNTDAILDLPHKVLVSFSAPGGSLQSPFQLVVYKDTKEDGVGWSMLYMGRCDFAKSTDIPVGKRVADEAIK
jgi:hypothetical protein